ncbi:MAG: shikimate dehydrogenase [Gammaproteobacteria bacterium]|nr:shikimate dehydrogenase [Gammaproteobacteria bacterium]
MLGYPVSHSRSPQIHRLFAEQFGMALRYEKIPVALGALSQAVDTLRAAGCCGINITVPLKEEAYRLAAASAPQAAAAHAANTLWWTMEGELIADNTDGTGLCRDLIENHQVDLRGRRILLLGAGGAAAGVIKPLLETAPEQLVVSNRTLNRAQALSSRFAEYGPIEWAAADARFERSFDVVVNATSSSITDELPVLDKSAIGAQTVCYDMFYASTQTPFCAWGQDVGAAHSFDGLGMLVEQAAAAFSIWHGLRPDTAQVLAAMRLG